ncbi:MAG: methyltransferase domain-containing protein [Anaerolineae bacterium]
MVKGNSGSTYLTYMAQLGATNLHPQGRRATARLIHALDLRRGDRVLEVGCGTGETMLSLVAHHSVSVDGVDVLPEMLRVAHRRLRLAPHPHRPHLIQCAAGSSLPLADEGYDRAYTESVLGFQDTAPTRALLGEIWRVLKGGGLYVANEAIWKRSAGEAVVAAINAAGLADFGLRQASERAWSVEEWRQVMTGAGFRVLSAQRLGEAPTGRVGDFSWRLGLSALLTRAYRLRGHLSPALRRQGARYRRLLAAHREDGQYVEDRLFVLQKP